MPALSGGPHCGTALSDRPERYRHAHHFAGVIAGVILSGHLGAASLLAVVSPCRAKFLFDRLCGTGFRGAIRCQPLTALYLLLVATGLALVAVLIALYTR